MDLDPRRELITDRKNLLDALRRMHEHNEAIYFQNRDETLDFFLRVDPDDDDDMRFELCAAFLGDTTATPNYRKIIDRSTTVNDDDALMYRDFSIDLDATHTSLDVGKAAAIINAHYEMRICPCNRHLIKDKCDMCFFCHMTASSDELHKVMCTICHQETPRVTVHRQSCCQQFMHPLCLARWQCSDASGTNPTCPMCRASVKIFSS